MFFILAHQLSRPEIFFSVSWMRKLRIFEFNCLAQSYRARKMGSWDLIRVFCNLVPMLAGQLLIQPVCLLFEENSWNRQYLNYFSSQRHARTIGVLRCRVDSLDAPPQTY